MNIHSRRISKDALRRIAEKEYQHGYEDGYKSAIFFSKPLTLGEPGSVDYASGYLDGFNTCKLKHKEKDDIHLYVCQD